MSDISGPSPLDNEVSETLRRLEAKLDEQARTLRMVAFTLGIRPPVRPEPAPSPVAPAPSPAPPPPPVAFELPATGPEPLRGESVDWEQRIGSAGLLWVGSIIVLLGAIFFIVQALTQGWISPAAQVAMAVAFGGGLVGLGEFLTPRNRTYGQTLGGIGLGVLYTAIYGGFAQHHLYSAELGVALLVGVTALAIALSARHQAKSFIVVGMLGGYFTAIGLGSDGLEYVFALVYLFALNGAVAYISARNNWVDTMALKMVFAGVATFSFLAGSWVPQIGSTFTYLLASMAASCLALWWAAYHHGKRDARRAEVVLSWVAATYYTLWLIELLRRAGMNEYTGLVTGCLALAFAGLAYFTVRALPHSKRQVATQGTIAVGLGLAAVGLQFDTSVWPVLWSAMAVGVMLIGSRLSDPSLRAVAWLVGSLAALVHVGAYWFSNQALGGPVLLNAEFFSGVLVIAMLGTLAAVRFKLGDTASDMDKLMAPLFGFGVVVFSMTALSRETIRFGALYFPGNTLLTAMLMSVVWAVYSSGLIVAGFWRKNSAVRWIGLTLLGFTISKVFLYDLVEVDEMYRWISFMSVGLLALAMAGLYFRQRDGLPNKMG